MWSEEMIIIKTQNQSYARCSTTNQLHFTVTVNERQAMRLYEAICLAACFFIGQASWTHRLFWQGSMTSCYISLHPAGGFRIDVWCIQSMMFHGRSVSLSTDGRWPAVCAAGECCWAYSYWSSFVCYEPFTVRLSTIFIDVFPYCWLTIANHKVNQCQHLLLCTIINQPPLSSHL